MKMRSVAPMRIAKYGYILVSAVFCLAGIMMMVMPAPSTTALGKFFGITLMVFGVIKLIGYYSKDLFRLAFQYDFQFGILMILLGLITLIQPGNVIHFICVSLGVCIMADSLFKGKTAFEAKSFGIKNWWMTLLFAILAGVAGIVLTFRPVQASHIITVFLGAALLIEGILNLSVSISLVKIVKHQKPDYIDAEYYEIKEEN